jgi:hypothetical protein
MGGGYLLKSCKREQPVSQPTAQLVFIKEGGQWKIAAGTSMKNTGG